MMPEAEEYLQKLREAYPDLTADEEAMVRERYPNVIFRRSPKKAEAILQIISLRVRAAEES